MAALRAALDAVANRQEDLAGDSPARREILKRALGEKAVPILSLDHVARRLQELEKTIRTETVSVDLDRSILWVDATLNGKPGYTMVVDPGAEDVRLSARVAAEIGVRPASGDGEAVVEIALAGGRTVTGAEGAARVGARRVLHGLGCRVCRAARSVRRDALAPGRQLPEAVRDANGCRCRHTGADPGPREAEQPRGKSRGEQAGGFAQGEQAGAHPLSRVRPAYRAAARSSPGRGSVQGRTIASVSAVNPWRPSDRTAMPS